MTARFELGASASVELLVSPGDQLAFSRLSGDTNPIHLDEAAARARGFDRPVVYGGLMLARLSQIVGTMLPGTSGLWSAVQMDFRAPLFVGEPAVVSAEVVQVSESTRTLVLRVTVRAGTRTIATGRAMATLFHDADAG